MHDCKREVTDGILGSEVARLVRVIGELPGVDRAQQTEALAELLATFRVYRSYLPDGREHLDATVAAVRERRPDLAPALDALHPVLSQAGSEAATRFEQTSGPVMAKGVEDSAYYRWARFVALNEVGGDPARFGSTVAEFHEAQVRRAERRPQSMTTLSTHDTKRSEDVRARLAVLAELPDEWAGLVRGLLARHPLADRPLAHLVWQNLVGAWPLSRERAHAYVEKAAREAGTSTTWTDPDEEFEGQLHALVDAAFDDPATAAEIDAFVARIAPLGWSNSLAQKLLQLTMPGVPDVYQGTELWDFSLVDPDNRRPVDYATRRRAAGLPGRRRGAGRRRDRGGEAARRLPGAAGPPGPPRVVRRLRAGRGHGLGGRPRGRLRPRRRRPGGHPAAGRPGAPTAGATPRCSCPTARGATCSPATGSSPTPPASRSTPCWPACRWPCWSATRHRRPPDGTAASSRPRASGAPRPLLGEPPAPARHGQKGSRPTARRVRLIVTNQAGAPSSWNLVSTRSASRAATFHPAGRVERRSQLVLADRVRAEVGTHRR